MPRISASKYEYAPRRQIPRWRVRLRARAFCMAAIALAALTLASCTAMDSLGLSDSREHAQAVEPMLAEAGFKSFAASTPEQLQRLKTLPPITLGYYAGGDGNANYWMADPDYCHCLFHGDEAAYQRFENLKLENQVAERDHRATQANQGQPSIGPPGLGFNFGSGFGLRF